MSATESAVTRPPLRTIARREIERMILHGSLLPGDQVKLAELARDTGLGMTPVREAMIEVAKDGLLNNQPGRGFFVPELTVSEANELLPMIWTLEGLAIRLTRLFSERHTSRLREINERFRGAGGDPAEAIALDSEWHRTLVERCGNSVLLETLSSIKRRASRYQYAFQRSAKHLPTSVKHHEDITSALERNDLSTAIRVLEDNWTPGLRFIAAHLG